MNENRANRAAQRTSLSRFFSHPAVGISGAIASLIGLPLAVYFYFAGRSTPRITAYVHPVRATVVKVGQASALTILFRGQPITGGDITAAQLAIWNAGSDPVRQSDILQPVIVRAPAPILEATIRKKSRDVIEVQLDRSQLANGRVGIAWNILEHGDGVIIQLIYAGSANAPLNVSGVIVGQGNVISMAYGGQVRSASEQFALEQKGNRIGGIAMIVIGIVFGAFWIRIMWKDRADIDKWEYLMLLQGLAFVAVGIWMWYRSAPPGPPFGF